MEIGNISVFFNSFRLFIHQITCYQKQIDNINDYEERRQAGVFNMESWYVQHLIITPH